MVLNRRITDSSHLARPRFKIKQPPMEPVSEIVSTKRNNRNAVKRWKLDGVATSSRTTPTPGNVIANTAVAAAATVSKNASGKINGMTIPAVTSAHQPTTHQKVRRILEEHAIWQERANKNNNESHELTSGRRPRGYSISSIVNTCSLNPPVYGNYNIVASRGELSRASFSVREISPSSYNAIVACNGSRKVRNETSDETNEIFVNGRENSRGRSIVERNNRGVDSRLKNREHSPSNWEKRASCNQRENCGSSRNKFSQNPAESSAKNLPKSSSVPENLKSVISGTAVELVPPVNLGATFGGKNSGEGILRKSSAFLASLTQSRGKNSKDRNNGSLNRVKTKNEIKNWRDHDRIAERSRFALLIGNRRAVTENIDEDDNRVLRRSPSCQNLDDPGKSRNKKNSTGVKKSVSFSSDTSFEEKRAPFRKTAVHEAKVYKKGVLRDVNAIENATKKVAGTWDSPSGDPKALLKATREADDRLVREIVTKARKSGLGSMDLNATDSSGRTAISYMAGNGSPAMLEVTLTFVGCDPNLPDNEGNTPLHFAAQAGQAECLNILLQRCNSIEVDARNVLGFTPLMKAALQGRTKCAKILLFAGANPTMRDHGKGLRAEQWARYCGRHVCADVIERFAKHRLLEKNISCRWGSEPELATKVLQGKVVPVPACPLPPPSTGFRSKIKRVFRTTSGPDRSFSLVSQLTSAALCASTPALPKPGEVSTGVKSLARPLSVPQLRVTLAGSHEIIERTTENKFGSNFIEKIESTIAKPPRSKKKNK